MDIKEETWSFEVAFGKMIRAMSSKHCIDRPKEVNSWVRDKFAIVNGRFVPTAKCSCGCMEYYKIYRKVVETAYFREKLVKEPLPTLL